MTRKIVKKSCRLYKIENVIFEQEKKTMKLNFVNDIPSGIVSIFAHGLLYDRFSCQSTYSLHLSLGSSHGSSKINKIRILTNIHSQVKQYMQQGLASLWVRVNWVLFVMKGYLWYENMTTLCRIPIFSIGAVIYGALYKLS